MREVDRAIAESTVPEFRDGDPVQHVILGWMGICRGRCREFPHRLNVERSPSWWESVSPEFLRAVDVPPAPVGEQPK